jgi:hypothetical protein
MPVTRHFYGKSRRHFFGSSHYIGGMLWRNSRGRPLNAPAAFIHPCQPTVAKEPPSGPGWAHELKHDGYRLQIHVRDGRVRLYTMNGNDWTRRYPRIVEEAARLQLNAIFGWTGSKMASLYTQNADRKRLAKDAIDKLLVNESATSIPSPKGKVRAAKRK